MTTILGFTDNSPGGDEGAPKVGYLSSILPAGHTKAIIRLTNIGDAPCSFWWHEIGGLQFYQKSPLPLESVDMLISFTEAQTFEYFFDASIIKIDIADSWTVSIVAPEPPTVYVTRYATIADVREIFELNDLGDTEIISDSKISKIINDVDAEIDAALYRRYTTPFTDPPQIIKTISTMRSTGEAMAWVRAGANGALIKPEIMTYYIDSGNTKLNELAFGKLEVTGSRRLKVASNTN